MDDLVFKADAGYNDLSNNKRSFQKSYPTINANRRCCLPTSPHDAVLDFARESLMENVKSKDRPEERLIRIGEVKRLTGISTATLYRKISAKEFPPPVQLGVAARAWSLSEVQNWIAGRIELRGASMTDTTNKTTTVPNSFSAPQMEDAMNRIKLQVDRLFRDAPPVRGQRCQNPVTGGFYVGFEDPIAPQKRIARCALLAREWFAIYGPQDAQPLPISGYEIEDRKYAWDSKQPSLSYIVSRFGSSLQTHNWDFNNHPSFEDFACGVMASQYTPDFVKKDEVLRKRYPPRPLRYLDPGTCWQTPEQHARTMGSHRPRMARRK